MTKMTAELRGRIRMTTELRTEIREGRNQERRKALAKSLTAHRSLDYESRDYKVTSAR